MQEPSTFGASHVLRVAGLAFVYAVTARLGLLIEPVGGFATLVWPPTGIALAALICGGRRLWPGVAIGAVAVNVWVGAPLAVALGIGVGNTLEALAGAYAVRSVPGFRPSLDRVRDAVAFVFLCAALSSVIAAAFGPLSLLAGGVIDAPQLFATARAWWVGDALGALILAPVLMTWLGARAVPAPARWGERIALTLALLVASLVVFGGFGTTGLAVRQPYVLSPLLLWAALRVGQRGVSLAILGLSIVAIGGTVEGHGPFVRDSLTDSLLFLQGFMATLAVTFLPFGAVIAERARVSQERAELLTREMAARRAIEAVERRGAVMSDASKELLSAGTDGVRVDAVARLALPFLGDYCVVELRDERGAATRIVLPEDASNDPDLAARLERIRAGPAATAPTAEPGMISVPFVARGRSFGSITFGSTDPERVWDDLEVSWATELAARVALAIDSSRLYQQLQRSIRMRDEILAVVSHDLRQSLHAVGLGTASLLEAAEPAQRPTLERMERATARMQRLIDDLLDAERIDTGSFSVQLEAHDAASIVANAIEIFEPVARNKGVRLEAPSVTGGMRIAVACDRERIDQVLSNLLANAIGATAKGGSVTVELADGDDEVRFSVRDTGPGIAKEHVERVFERHWRAPGEQRKGTGLGLFIAQGIVREHRGRIWVESEVGRGSCFSFAIPR